MKLLRWTNTGFGLCVVLSALAAPPADAQNFDYRVGRGIRDITGPAMGVQMWGFVREGQITEGIHFRLWSRAFVIAEAASDKRIAFVTADLGSVTHFIHLQVVDELQKRYGDLYTAENVILSATHTHAGPGGYWHYGVDSPIGSPFLAAHFDAIVAGITDSIVAAHEDLQPARILINRGVVEGAGANRSAPAYLNNPEDERGRYDSDTDKEMTLLKFAGAHGDLGALNWFAVHPTAMTYNNRLISGDHKGNAAYRFEKMRGPDGLVAAFAQTNCGDVTANLNLDNTGPGADEFETTHIIAERQLQVALQLFDGARETLSGPIDYRQAYVEFPGLRVDDAFTHSGPRFTCPSAYGYAFAAGSTEDGGGNALFREGMTQQNAMVDNLVKEQFKIPPPTDGCRDCQQPKAILFATGELDPPGQTQIVPITLARIGNLALVAVPAEFTTMAGRRLRDTVANTLGDSVSHVVLAGYANDYTGYVTTKEEYDTQQYEGGHTLFGPWTLAAYQQEFTRLADAMARGARVDRGPRPRDLRGAVPETALGTGFDRIAAGASPGDVVLEPKRSYRRGARVEVGFRSGHPQIAYRTGNSYLAVQRQVDAQWETVATDNDWETRCRWESAPEGSLDFFASWDIPEAAERGVYRIVHEGSFKAAADAPVESFTAVSPAFKVK